jgi:ketosteroid isomerase-like protein
MSSNVETIRAAHQAFNRRDFDAIVRQLAGDFVYHDHASGKTFAGGNGFRQFLAGWTSAFSNAEVSEPIYIDGGDVIVAEFTGRGTHDGPLGPAAATRRQMVLPFCEIIRFDRAGKMISGGLYYDQLSLLAQLGLAPVALAG